MDLYLLSRASTMWDYGQAIVIQLKTHATKSNSLPKRKIEMESTRFPPRLPKKRFFVLFCKGQGTTPCLKTMCSPSARAYALYLRWLGLLGLLSFLLSLSPLGTVVGLGSWLVLGQLRCILFGLLLRFGLSFLSLVVPSLLSRLLLKLRRRLFFGLR